MDNNIDIENELMMSIDKHYKDNPSSFDLDMLDVLTEGSKQYDSLRGKRFLHFLSPLIWESNIFRPERDSNFQVTMKVVDWFPQCHHYIIVPEKSTINITKTNVTLLKYPYPLNLVSNRSNFDSKVFSSLIKIREMDIDFLFMHQPELLSNVMSVLGDKRYGEIVNKFLVFNWIDCPASRGSPALTHFYMRQLESINICTKAYFHSDRSIEYLASNFKKPQAVNINTDYIKTKTSHFPLSNASFPTAEPIQMPKKKTIVFNHRWSQSTGINLFESYMENLDTKKYQVWCTANDASEKFIHQPLSRGEYRYLLENSYCSVCFVDTYATWNMSVQDGIKLGKPVLVYRHPTLEKILGIDYPFFFDSEKEFYKLLDVLPEKFEWKLPDFDEQFRMNLYTDLISCSKNTRAIPKTALEWAYCIRNGIQYKSEITNQVQRNIATNSNWQYIRRWLLWNGFVDDPESSHPKYSIRPGFEESIDELIKDVKLEIQTSTVKEVTSYTKTSKKFFKFK